MGQDKMGEEGYAKKGTTAWVLVFSLCDSGYDLTSVSFLKFSFYVTQAEMLTFS